MISVHGAIRREESRETFKIVATSDWHADWTTAGVDRFDEVAEAAHRAADAAIEERADIFAFLGDLLDPDRGSRTFRGVHLSLEIATKLAHRGITSIWLAGNHDVIENGRGDTSLTPLRAVESLLTPMAGSDIFVAETPRAIEIQNNTDRVITLACLPFTATSHGYDAEAALLSMTEGAAREDVVVLSHLTIPGLESDEAISEMPRGREIVLPEKLAHERAGLVLQGHYHRQQRTPEGTWIAGSLARLTFAPGIEQHRPGYLVCTV